VSFGLSRTQDGLGRAQSRDASLRPCPPKRGNSIRLWCRSGATFCTATTSSARQVGTPPEQDLLASRGAVGPDDIDNEAGMVAGVATRNGRVKRELR
jgi:hypothetical protein